MQQSCITKLYEIVSEYFTGFTDLTNVENFLIKFTCCYKCPWLCCNNLSTAVNLDNIFKLDSFKYANQQSYESATDDKISKVFELFFTHGIIIDYINSGDIALFMTMNNHTNILKFIGITIKYKFYRRCLESEYCNQDLTNKIFKYLLERDDFKSTHYNDLIFLFIEKYDDSDAAEFIIRIIDNYFNFLTPKYKVVDYSFKLSEILLKIIKSEYNNSCHMLQTILTKIKEKYYEISKNLIWYVLKPKTIDDLQIYPQSSPFWSLSYPWSSPLWLQIPNEFHMIKKIQLFIIFWFDNGIIVSDFDIAHTLEKKYNKKKITFDVLINFNFYPKDLNMLNFSHEDRLFKQSILEVLDKVNFRNEQFRHIDILNEQIRNLSIRNDFLYKELNIEPETYEVDMSDDTEDQIENLTECSNVLLNQNFILEETLLCKPGSDYYQTLSKNFEQMVKK